jgi:hypothetical protein
VVVFAGSSSQTGPAQRNNSAMAETLPDDLWHQLDELAHDRPGLWAKCYPKIYKGVDGGEHYSAKFVGYFLLTVAFKIEQPEVRVYKHFNETIEAIWASRLAAYRVPIFWLTRDITEALKLTTLPVTLDFTTMKLPFEAAVFMLPKGSLTYQSEATDVVCASYARAAMHEEITSINPAAVETITGRGDFSVFAGMLNGLLLNWSHPWEQPLDIAQLDATIQDTPNNSLQTQFQTDITAYGKHFMARVAHLVFNTLRLMLARPELVSVGSLVKQVHNKRHSIKAFWTPNTVGKDYRLRRESHPLGGTHASPRGHWVRGFWRDQACGPSHSQHKETWIEPFWRGGD